MYTTSLRGLGMSAPAQVMVPVPQPGGLTTQEPTAETSLANAAYQDANDYQQFVATSNAPNYANPAAYTANMIEYAKELCYVSWASYVCPAGYDPVARGTYWANQVFAALKLIPYNGTNVYAWWVAHPIPASYDTPPPQTPYNPASVPGSNTLDNVAPSPVSVDPGVPTSALNPPVQNWFPLNPTQVANGTTGESTLPDMSGATSWLQSNWMLVAGAVAAVVILPSLLGGKR